MSPKVATFCLIALHPYMQWFATSQITVYDGMVGDQYHGQELLVNVEYCGHYKVGDEAGQH